MTTVGSYEAKTKLPELLRRVEKGEKITITHRGRPVAMLTPVEDEALAKRIEAIERLKEFGKGKSLGMPIKDAIEEGRRY
jgi:prevent-host-death family protein